MSNSSIEERFKAMFEDAKTRDSYHVEKAILKLTEDIYKFMEIKEINKSQLADKLGKSNAFVTKILNGTNNFTLATIIKVARALDLDFNFSFKEKQSNYKVIEKSPLISNLELFLDSSYFPSLDESILDKPEFEEELTA